MSRTARILAAGAFLAASASLAQPASATTVCRTVGGGFDHSIASACVIVDPNGPSVDWTCTIGDYLACT